MRGWSRAIGSAALVAVVAVLGVRSADPVTAAGSSCGWGKFSDERRPGACWRPFSVKSPFNRRLPAAPRQPAGSPLIARTVAGWGPGLRFIVGTADTPDDFDHPIYFSARSNPKYRVNCVEFGGDCRIDGLRVRIPPRARAAGGSDGSLAVIDQRNGWEYDFWQARSRPAGGGRLNVSWGGRTRIGTVNASGLRAEGTAAGFALSAGVIRPAELRAGRIDHALFMTVSCTNGRSVYPAHNNTGRVCSDSLLAELGSGLSGVAAPAMGQHFFLTMSNSQIDSLELPAWQKTILRAMARYGLFVGDTGGPGWGIKVESGSSFTSFGKADQWVTLAQGLGLPAYDARSGARHYTFDMRYAVDWGSELSVAAPCVSRGRC